MKDLTVCLLNDSFPPIIDGVANAVLNYASVIQSHYGKAVVATPQYPGVSDDYPFPVIRYPSINTTRMVGYRAGFPFSADLLCALRQASPQIIHVHCPLISALLARTLRERVDAPIVLTYHTKFDIDINNAFRSGLVRSAARRSIVNNIQACDEVWTVSRGAAENLRQLGYTGDCVLMENGVDFRRGRVSDAVSAELRQRYALPHNVPVFLFVGRMMWYKGLRILLDALSLLQKDGMDFRMLFVGGGGNAEEVFAYADTLRLGDRCVFVGSVTDREKLRAYFCAADLFLFPSTFDTNGIVVREAAACALPSLLIRGSCAAEGVLDGQNGLLAEENADSVAATVSAICQQPDELRRIGRKAMDELYLSWEDSVYRATQRYGILMEKYRSGGRVALDAPGDDFIAAIAEALAAVEALRRVPQELADLSVGLWNKLNTRNQK